MEFLFGHFRLVAIDCNLLAVIRRGILSSKVHELNSSVRRLSPSQRRSAVCISEIAISAASNSRSSYLRLSSALKDLGMATRAPATAVGSHCRDLSREQGRLDTGSSQIGFVGHCSMTNSLEAALSSINEREPQPFATVQRRSRDIFSRN
jgi:hypothetical protein